MSGLSQYQSVFRIAKPDIATNVTHPRTAKRNRQSVSCLNCRRRKLKCDRQLPCLSCSKREEASSCTYPTGGHNVHHRRGGTSRASSEAQLRLQKLEEMVTSLMQSNERQLNTPSQIPSSTGQHVKDLSVYSSPENSEVPSRGRLHMNGSETNYIGATHWATILENIREIQGVLSPNEDQNDQTSPASHPSGPEILFDASPLTLAEVLSSLPSRPVVDKLLSLYFNARHAQIRMCAAQIGYRVLILLAIIHSGKFQGEYESFWVDPSSVSFLWISILFSALHIGSQVDDAGILGVDASERCRGLVFLTRACQALVTGGYHKARPYSVEAVLLYALCKYMRNEDPDADAWMIMGIAARLAMRMGYHRDPRHLANITPFEAEMRRRTFYVVEIFDLLFSFQAGLPAIIHEEECDTEPPSNLLDSDFDEDCKALPPARPPSDPTPVLYYCYKCRLAKVFRRVIRHALSPRAKSYEETMQLDMELCKMQKEIPPSLRMKPLGSSITDQPHIILNRLNIDILYQKNLCVLHRNYLNYDRSDPRYGYSRKTCTDAALKILEYQAELHSACQPGGQLCNEKWMPSSIILHDYLLAAMIISLDLYESFTKPAAVSPEELEKRDEKYNVLKYSYDILSSRNEFSRDARRGSKVLAVMLSKVRGPTIASTRADAPQVTMNVSQDSLTADNATGTSANSSGTSLWNVTGLNVSGQNFLVDNPALSDLDTLDPLITIFSEIDNIDWGLIDQCLLGGADPGDIPNDW